MAGRPLRTAMILELEKRVRETFDTDLEPDKTILDYVCERTEDGVTLTQLARELSESIGSTIDRSFLSRYLRGSFPSAAERLPEARATGAGSMVEAAIDIADSVEETREAIMKAKLRVDTRTWVAGRWNRAEYGESKQPTISISIGSLHLDALRARPVLEATLVPALPAPSELVDAEVDEGL